jgi:hypothetical protein
VPLADLLPEFDVHELHERRIAAPPERAIELALAAPAAPDAFVCLLFRLRGVPRAATIADLFAELGLEERERTPTSFVGIRGRRVRIGVDLVARADRSGSLLSTETRVRAADRAARIAFRAYWLVVGPFSKLIRRRWLRAVARSAEQ